MDIVGRECPSTSRVDRDDKPYHIDNRLVLPYTPAMRIAGVPSKLRMLTQHDMCRFDVSVAWALGGKHTQHRLTSLNREMHTDSHLYSVSVK